MFWIALTILLSLITLSIHELGHAWAMRFCGVAIDEIGLLGIRIRHIPFLSFKYTFKGAEKPTTFSLHPFLVGAFVRTDDVGMDHLEMKDRTFISGAGPFANFLYSLVAYGIVCLTQPDGGLLLRGGLCFALTALLIIFRVFFCRFGVLMVGILLAGYTLSTLLIAPETASANVAGPVTIVNDMSTLYRNGASPGNEFRVALCISAIVSLMVGTTNALPLPPMDGGHIAKHYLDTWNKKVGGYYNKAGFYVFLAFIGSALTTDAGKLLFR